MKAWYPNCIGIEDAESGIAAIKAAGMKSVGVCTSHTLCTADRKVDSTAEITLPLLQKLAGSREKGYPALE